MKSKTHVSEATLNMYLDGELSAEERDRVEAHLAICTECRSELLALRALFSALDDLRLAPAPAPNLGPGVLDRIRPRRGITRVVPWLIPTLQAAAALVLLAWGGTRLDSYWALVSNALPSEALRNGWGETIAWLTDQGVTLSTWPATTWDTLQGWFAWPAGFGSLRLTLAQLAALGITLLSFWLIGNAVLLHRALLNGHATQ